MSAQRANPYVTELDRTGTGGSACLQTYCALAQLFVARVGQCFAIHFHNEVRPIGEHVEAAPFARALHAIRQRRMDADDTARRRGGVRIADVDLVAASKAARICRLLTPDEQPAVRIFFAPELSGHLEVAEAPRTA